MTALHGDDIVDVALDDATRELKTVPAAMIAAAREIA